MKRRPVSSAHGSFPDSRRETRSARSVIRGRRTPVPHVRGDRGPPSAVPTSIPSTAGVGARCTRCLSLLYAFVSGGLGRRRKRGSETGRAPPAHDPQGGRAFTALRSAHIPPRIEGPRGWPTRPSARPAAGPHGPCRRAPHPAAAQKESAPVAARSRRPQGLSRDGRRSPCPTGAGAGRPPASSVRLATPPGPAASACVESPLS